MGDIKNKIRKYLYFRKTDPNVQMDYRNMRKSQFIGLGVFAIIGVRVLTEQGERPPISPGDACALITAVFIFVTFMCHVFQCYPLQRPLFKSKLLQWTNKILIWSFSYAVIMNATQALGQGGTQGALNGACIWLIGFALLKLWSCMFHYLWGKILLDRIPSGEKTAQDV